MERFTITADQLEFFSKHGFIEFEGLFAQDRITSLQEEIDRTLQQRSKSSTPTNIFDNGYNLWTDSVTIKKIAAKRSVLATASTLFNAPILRIAFDQYLSTEKGQSIPFSTSLRLEDTSCIKPLSGAFLLRLSDPCPEESENRLLPGKKGNVLFIAPHFSIHWEMLSPLVDAQFYLVVLAPEKALYHLENRDPHTHALKKLGLVFGDRLSQALHPIIFRR